MSATLELLGIVLGFGLPITYLTWTFIPPAVVKPAGFLSISLVVGYPMFLANALMRGFIAELLMQRRG